MKPSIQNLAKFYCKQHGIIVSDLTSPNQLQELCIYRHGFIALCKSQSIPIKKISEFLNRTRVTVYKSVKKHNELINDRWYQSHVLKHGYGTMQMIN